MTSLPRWKTVFARAGGGNPRLACTLASALLAVSSVGPRPAAAQGTLPDYLRGVAGRWSPIILEETADNISTPGAVDHLLPVDFDANTIGADNAAHASNGAFVKTTPTVYFSIVETGTSSEDGYFFIGYYFFHPIDAGFDFCGSFCPTTTAHENDLEGAWLVVKKEPYLPEGEIEVATTQAHGTLLPFYTPGTRTTLGRSPCCDDGIGTAGAWGGAINMSSYVYDGLPHPVVAIRSRKHGTYMAADCSPGATATGLASNRFGIKQSESGEIERGVFSYTACIHEDNGLIVYDAAPREDPEYAEPLPADMRNGFGEYLLVDLAQSPIWQLRSVNHQLFTGSLLTLDGGQPAYDELDAALIGGYTPDHHANPMWAWTGKTGCFLGECWYSFGDDDTWNYTGALTYPINSVRGKILTDPAAEAAFRFKENILQPSWLPQLDLPTIYNPYSFPTITPPPPPLPLSVAIDGPDEVVEAQTNSWTAEISGGTAPYTITWSGALSGGNASVTGQLYADDVLYLDVSDALGHTLAVSKSIAVTPQDCTVSCLPVPQ